VNDISLAEKPTLTGERVLLRPIDVADTDVLLEAMEDPEIQRLTGSHPRDFDATPELRRRAVEEWYRTRHEHADRLDLAIVDRASGECAGDQPVPLDRGQAVARAGRRVAAPGRQPRRDPLVRPDRGDPGPRQQPDPTRVTRGADRLRTARHPARDDRNDRGAGEGRRVSQTISTPTASEPSVASAAMPPSHRHGRRGTSRRHPCRGTGPGSVSPSSVSACGTGTTARPVTEPASAAPAAACVARPPGPRQPPPSAVPDSLGSPAGCGSSDGDGSVTMPPAGRSTSSPIRATTPESQRYGQTR
jgi:hypothetical protein